MSFEEDRTIDVDQVGDELFPEAFFPDDWVEDLRLGDIRANICRIVTTHWGATFPNSAQIDNWRVVMKWWDISYPQSLEPTDDEIAYRELLAQIWRPSLWNGRLMAGLFVAAMFGNR